MTDTGTLRQISPDELDEVLDRVKQEKHRELVLLGPGVYIDPSPEDWPDELKGRAVLQLSKYLWRFQKKLKELGHFFTKYESTEHLKRLFKDQLVLRKRLLTPFLNAAWIWLLYCDILSGEIHPCKMGPIMMTKTT